VAGHADQPGLLGGQGDALGAGPAVRQRDLHLHVLAGPQGGHRLLGVQRSGAGQDDRVDVVAGQHLVQLGAGVRRAIAGRDLLGLLDRGAHHRTDHRVVDHREGVEVLDAEGPGPDEGDPDRPAHGSTARTMWPTAVLEAGTW
jgi:hypothetical protein